MKPSCRTVRRKSAPGLENPRGKNCGVSGCITEVAGFSEDTGWKGKAADTLQTHRFTLDISGGASFLRGILANRNPLARPVGFGLREKAQPYSRPPLVYFTVPYSPGFPAVVPWNLHSQPMNAV